MLRNGLFISGADKAFYEPKKARGHFSRAAKINFFGLALGQVLSAHVRVKAGEIVVEGLFNFAHFEALHAPPKITRAHKLVMGGGKREDRACALAVELVVISKKSLLSHRSARVAIIV